MLNFLPSIPHYQDRVLVYRLIGSKYGRKWGSVVLEWFVEQRIILEQENSWIARWDLFSREFDRKIPLSSLYLVLGKLTADGFLEMKMEKETHYFKLHKNAEEAIHSLSRMVEKEH